MTVHNKLVEALLKSEVDIVSHPESSVPASATIPSSKEFHAPEFIREWFRERGSAYFFLFKKNLRITSMQFADLPSLVRRFTTSDDGEIIRDLQFSNVDEFGLLNHLTDMLAGTWTGPSRRSLPPTPPKISRRMIEVCYRSPTRA